MQEAWVLQRIERKSNKNEGGERCRKGRDGWTKQRENRAGGRRVIKERRGQKQDKCRKERNYVKRNRVK